MTQDTQFQKFLTLKGNGGTGESVAVSLIQHVVGITNMSRISLKDLNKKFFRWECMGVFFWGGGFKFGLVPLLLKGGAHFDNFKIFL